MIGLVALFALSALVFASAGSGGNPVSADIPPQLPSLCYGSSDCASGYVCVNDACVPDGSAGGDGGSGGGSGYMGQQHSGRDWNWSGWKYPNQGSEASNQAGLQPGNSTELAGQELPPSPPPSGNGDAGNAPKNPVNSAVDAQTQAANGIGDLLSMIMGDIGRNPVVIGIAAAIAVLVAGAGAGLAYLFFARKKQLY